MIIDRGVGCELRVRRTVRGPAAKLSFVNQIDFHGGTSFRFGDCQPNPKTYPHGFESELVVHEGKPVGTPDPGEFWRVVEEHRLRGQHAGDAPGAAHAARLAGHVRDAVTSEKKRSAIAETVFSISLRRKAFSVRSRSRSAAFRRVRRISSLMNGFDT